MPFAHTDVEFATAAQRDDFHEGNHTLRFLERAALELRPREGNPSKYLTMRYLGRNGIDRGVSKYIDRLVSEYKRDCIRLKKAA